MGNEDELNRKRNQAKGVKPPRTRPGDNGSDPPTVRRCERQTKRGASPTARIRTSRAGPHGQLHVDAVHTGRPPVVGAAPLARAEPGEKRC